MHFVVVQVITHDNFSKAGPAMGDTLQTVFAEMAGGRRIGVGALSCTVIIAVHGNYGALCNVETRFYHRGRIELQGAFNLKTGVTTFNIVGGSGAFVGARGTGVGHSIRNSNGTRVQLTFH
jgi:hypothetical protein